jgi:hypothetical protein
VRAGKKIGLPVFLFAAPLVAAPNAAPESLDRNVFGQTSVEIAAARAGSARWQAYIGDGRGGGHDLPAAADVLAPNGQAFEARVRTLAALAAVPDLAGVVLVDTQPPGYAGQRKNSTHATSTRRSPNRATWVTRPATGSPFCAARAWTPWTSCLAGALQRSSRVSRRRRGGFERAGHVRDGGGRPLPPVFRPTRPK